MAHLRCEKPRRRENPGGPEHRLVWEKVFHQEVLDVFPVLAAADAEGDPGSGPELCVL